MKQVKVSKFMYERAKSIVQAINPEAITDNDQVLAYALELPNTNIVKGEEYATLLADITANIRDGVEMSVEDYETRFKAVVLKKARVLSPEVRQARYEKACAKLAEKYGVKGE